jgi:RNA polymerase sigma-70 factor, ECF subfamily
MHEGRAIAGLVRSSNWTFDARCRQSLHLDAGGQCKKSAPPLVKNPAWRKIQPDWSRAAPQITYSDRSRDHPMASLTAALPASASDAGQKINAEALIVLRTEMLRFAQLQLRNRETAEDMVQEAIESALRNASSFSGNSSLKTWVFAILKNRIIDYLRQAGRTVPMSSLVDEGEDWQERLDALFNERGGWRDSARPTPWPDPEQSMQNKQFWVVSEACLDHLPANTARVFMMREFLGVEADEICAQLGLTTSNCHVILHRARLKLRGCLGNGWSQMGDA